MGHACIVIQRRVGGSLCRAVAISCVVAAATSAHAQELEPRAYVNTPVGLNFLIAGYVYTAGEIVVDPALPLEDANLTVHSGALAYVRSLDIWGNSGKLDLLLPYASASGTASSEGRSVIER